MTMLASQITSLTVVYSIVYSSVNQRKHQSSASLAFVREIHRGPVNFPHKWTVTRKMFPFDDVIMTMELRLFCIETSKWWISYEGEGYRWCRWAFCALQCRHNGRDGVSNHQPHDCLLSRLLRRRSKKTPKLQITGLWVGNSSVNSPHKGPVTRKMFPFDDVIMKCHKRSGILSAIFF